MNANSQKKSRANATSDPQDLELEAQIRLRAYEIYEARGQEDGHEQEDWFRAKEAITINLDWRDIQRTSPVVTG